VLFIVFVVMVVAVELPIIFIGGNVVGVVVGGDGVLLND
jgi:hypothetical protein